MSKKTFVLIAIVTIFVLAGITSFFYEQSLPKKDADTSRGVTETQSSGEGSEDNPQRFIFMADTGTASPSQVKVASAITEKCPELTTCEAGFILGDVIYEEGVKTVKDKQFMTKFEEIYQDVPLSFYIALGNHDYQGCEECYVQYAKTSDKWRMPAYYYVEKFDNVDFFILDTENFNKTQQDWLINELQKSTAKWKVVGAHRAILTYEVTKLKENWIGQEELAKILCTSADFYIAGHSHVLEDNGPLPNCTVRQLVSGTGGSSVRDAVEPHPGIFGASQNGFVALSITPKTALVEFINEDSKVLHSFTIKK